MQKRRGLILPRRLLSDGGGEVWQLLSDKIALHFIKYIKS